MNKFLTYSGLFVVAMVLQLFVFDAVRLGPLVRPPVYIAFLVLLPLDTKQIVMLALGLLLGVTVDFFEGTAGLATMVVLPVALARRYALMWVLGKDIIEQDAMPSVKTLGADKFFRYISPMVFGYCVLFFVFEALTFRYLHLVLVRAALSGAITLVAVWAISLLFTVKVRIKNG